MAAVRRDHVTCEPAGLDLQRGWKGLCSRLIHLTAAKTNMKFAHFTVNTRSWATVVPRLVWFFFQTLLSEAASGVWPSSTLSLFLSGPFSPRMCDERRRTGGEVQRSSPTPPQPPTVLLSALAFVFLPGWLGCQRRRCCTSNYHNSGRVPGSVALVGLLLSSLF